MLDHLARLVASELRLHGGHLVGRCRGIDQGRALLYLLNGPGEQGRDGLVRILGQRSDIDGQRWMFRRKVLHLPKRCCRTGAREHEAGAADLCKCTSTLALRDEPRGAIVLRQADGHARAPGDQRQR